MSCVNWCTFSGTIPEKDDPESELLEWEIELSTFSNWFRNEVLGIFEGNTPTIPAQLYVAAHTTLCTAGTPGTEVVGNGYTRTAITFERVSDIQRWNPTGVSSPAATAPWGEIKSFSIWDSPTGGNYYAFGNLITPITVDASKALTWAANKVVIGLGAAP